LSFAQATKTYLRTTLGTSWPEAGTDSGNSYCGRWPHPTVCASCPRPLHLPEPARSPRDLLQPPCPCRAHRSGNAYHPQLRPSPPVLLRPPRAAENPKRLVIGLFALLSNGQRHRVGLSVREALAHSHLPSTKIYNDKRKSIVSVSISEWAAALTILSFAFRRELRTACNPDHNDQSISPLQAALEVFDAFTILISALYYYPRVEVDGEKACRNRATPEQIKDLGDDFFSLVVAACLRGDTAAFGRSVDVPNVHRLCELLEHVIPLLLHVRPAQELSFENAHRPIERAIVTGNGCYAAERGLERIRQGELASRILPEPLHFNIKPEWLEHRGVQSLLRTARPLWSQPSGLWRCSGRQLTEDQVPAGAHRPDAERWSASFVVHWRSRATRGEGRTLLVGDAVGVLVLGSSGVDAVDIARGRPDDSSVARVAYFRTIAFLETSVGLSSAVVHPFACLPHTAHVSVDRSRFLFLALDSSVRRALVLHSCRCSCSFRKSGAVHTDANR